MVLVLFSFMILQCITCYIGAYPLFVEIISLWDFVFLIFHQGIVRACKFRHYRGLTFLDAFRHEFVPFS